MKEAQVAFNAYIRERDKNEPCISCGKPLKDKYDAGHFIASTYKVHTFNEDNVHAQCVTCNQYKHGNLLEYRDRLIQKVGYSAVRWMEMTKHQEYKPTRERLREIKEYYKQKIKELK